MWFVIKEDWAALLTLALIPPMESSSFVMLQLRCVRNISEKNLKHSDIGGLNVTDEAAW